MQTFQEGMFNEDPSKFQAPPRIPGYKHKTQGRNMLVYTIQALSRGKKGLKRGMIKPSQLAIEVKTKQKDINQVRIVPRKGFYVVEAVYEQEEKQAPVNPAYYAGIDIGMNNLVALTSNKPGFRSVLVNGRPVKSINQFYNKRKAELQSQLRRKGTTKRMERMTNRRNRRIDHYMHTASKQIIDLLMKEGIGVFCIGKNDAWKQEANMGKRTNQNFRTLQNAMKRYVFWNYPHCTMMQEHWASPPSRATPRGRPAFPPMDADTASQLTNLGAPSIIIEKHVVL